MFFFIFIYFYFIYNLIYFYIITYIYIIYLFKRKISIKTFFNDTSKEYNNIGIILENMDNFDNLEECITCKYFFI